MRKYNKEDMKPTGRRYSSVVAMLKGEGFPKAIIKRVQELVAKDKKVAK